MALTFPRDLFLDFYMGRWWEVTALAESRSLRQADPVTVTWGLPGEQGGPLAPPSVMEAALNNTGGHWTPGNPLGIWYEYLLGRNIPTRLGLRAIRDAFGRTVASGWGTSDTADTWTTVTSGSGSSAVGSGVGTHTQTSANAWVLTYVTDAYADGQVAASAFWNLNVAGGALEPLNLVLRYQSSGSLSGEHYLLRVSVSTAEVLTVAIHHSTLGLLSSIATVATLTPGANFYRAKFQVEGQTLRGKVYSTGPPEDLDQNEPLGWQVSAHDERLVTGHPGVRTGVAAGNTNVPVTVSYDDFRLSLMRHTGELTRLQPSWDVTHRHKTASIKCSDITQRLGRPNRASLSSSLRRYVASTTDLVVTDCWPLDEATSEPAHGLNTSPAGARAAFVRFEAASPVRGAVSWGNTDQVHTAAPAFAGLSNDGQLNMPVQNTTLSTQWSAMWAMSLTPDAGANVWLRTVDAARQFNWVFYTDGTYELYGGSGIPSTFLASGVLPLPSTGLVGFWVTMGLSAWNAGGGNIGYHINLNGETLGNGTWVGAGAFSALRQVEVAAAQVLDGGQGEEYWSSVVVSSTRFDGFIGGLSVGTRLHRAIMGYRGETALARAVRLCGEEGIPLDYWGDPASTRVMGPQRPIPLMDQLVECATADGALLFAPRYTPGIAFRSRRSMCARSVDGTLSYSAGHVAPPFTTSADDRPTANLVRAERENGGFLVLEQTTGPMNTGEPGTDVEAVGVNPADVRANLESDAQLGDLGGWVLALGTVPEVRFPRVGVNLRAPELASGSTARDLLGLHVGSRLQVTGMTAADVYRDLEQLVRGGRETFRNVRSHAASLNTAPYEKYRAAVYGDAGSRYDGAGLVTTLDSQLSAGTTGGRAVTTSAGLPWTTAIGAFPMDVLIGGERITLSGITGAGPGQTMTISARAVNGVSKTHPAGTRVYLHAPVYYS